MNKTVRLIAVILAAILVFAGVYYLYNTLSEKYASDGLVTEKPAGGESDTGGSGESPGNSAYPAPDFTVTDKDGNKVRLSDFKGKPVVLNFWATWCYYCKVEMPDFETMYKKYGDEVQFMMVDLTDGIRETETDALKHVIDNGFTFPVFFDTVSEATIAYGVSGIPATYFIDADGNLVAHANGTVNAESLERGIQMITDAE